MLRPELPHRSRGLVKRPEDWKWSSYRYYQQSDDVLLEINV